MMTDETLAKRGKLEQSRTYPRDIVTFGRTLRGRYAWHNLKYTKQDTLSLTYSYINNYLLGGII